MVRIDERWRGETRRRVRRNSSQACRAEPNGACNGRRKYGALIGWLPYFKKLKAENLSAVIYAPLRESCVATLDATRCNETLRAKHRREQVHRLAPRCLRTRNNSVCRVRRFGHRYIYACCKLPREQKRHKRGSSFASRHNCNPHHAPRSAALLPCSLSALGGRQPHPVRHRRSRQSHQSLSATAPAFPLPRCLRPCIPPPASGSLASVRGRQKRRSTSPSCSYHRAANRSCQDRARVSIAVYIAAVSDCAVCRPVYCRIVTSSSSCPVCAPCRDMVRPISTPLSSGRTILYSYTHRRLASRARYRAT